MNALALTAFSLGEIVVEDYADKSLSFDDLGFDKSPPHDCGPRSFKILTEGDVVSDWVFVEVDPLDPTK